MIVVGIDPGPEKSAAVWWDGRRVDWPLWIENEFLGDHVAEQDYDHLAYEWVHCYGRAVGASVFEVAFWLGRFHEMSPVDVTRLTRREVCAELVGDLGAKKQQVNAYLLDTYGPKGTKKKPGPLYGVSGHIWDALAVAVVAHRRLTRGPSGGSDETEKGPATVGSDAQRRDTASAVAGGLG